MTEGSRWRVVGTSVVGRSHQVAGEACQDRFRVSQAGTRLVVVVCDGAGSAMLGGEGAEIVAGAAHEFLMSGSSDGPCRATGEALVRACLDSLHLRCNVEQRPVGDFATTLTCVRLQDDQLEWYQVGDGLVVISEAGRPYALTVPMRGEHSNETIFVTSGSATQQIQCGQRRITGCTGSLAVISDGLLPALYNAQSRVVSQAVEQVASWLDNAPERLVLENVERTIEQRLGIQSGDDCTMVVARRVYDSTEQHSLACPECGRWLTYGLRVVGGIEYVCDNCETHVADFAELLVAESLVEEDDTVVSDMGPANLEMEADQRGRLNRLLRRLIGKNP